MPSENHFKTSEIRQDPADPAGLFAGVQAVTDAGGLAGFVREIRAEITRVVNDQVRSGDLFPWDKPAVLEAMNAAGEAAVRRRVWPDLAREATAAIRSVAPHRGTLAFPQELADAEAEREALAERRGAVFAAEMRAQA